MESIDRPAGRVQAWRAMDELKNYSFVVQPGPPQRTVVVAFYERYRKEKGSVPIHQLEATFFAEYLLEHLEEFQAELKLYMSIPRADPYKKLEAQRYVCLGPSPIV